ncbi:MAG: hypothetical protein SH848_20655 [Saprospiraceae bacterium]|nr:hypothetical protein [Saprospiraceae bacterium]MDZ4706353.1 hypothetical protein [Saprospiraceae bacterium]
MSLPEFAEYFVTSFNPDTTRKDLFDNYQNYLADLNEILSYRFFQWIDGSFITTKRNPKDIDLVSFVDHQDYEKSKKILENRFSPQNVRETYKVDAYIAPRYPEDHRKYAIYHSDSLYWRNLFGKTRVNRAKRQFEKGIVQLNFEQNG